MTRQLSVPQVRLFFTLHLGIAFFGGLWIGAVLSPNIKGTRASRTPYHPPHITTPPPPPVKAGANIFNVGTQSVKSGCCMSELGFDSRRLHHGGAMVSTGSKRTMEIASRRPLQMAQTQKRQLPVAEGSLKLPVDGGSPRQRNPQPSSEVLRNLTFSAAEKCRVPARLLFSQVRQESAFKVNALSSAGAAGLMQVKPYHASWPLDLWDPETNLNVGACLLRRHYERMGSWKLALDAYHGGQYRRATSNTTRSYTSRVMKGAE